MYNITRFRHSYKRHIFLHIVHSYLMSPDSIRLYIHICLRATKLHFRYIQSKTNHYTQLMPIGMLSWRWDRLGSLQRHTCRLLRHTCILIYQSQCYLLVLTSRCHDMMYILKYRQDFHMSYSCRDTVIKEQYYHRGQSTNHRLNYRLLSLHFPHTKIKLSHRSTSRLHSY